MLLRVKSQQMMKSCSKDGRCCWIQGTEEDNEAFRNPKKTSNILVSARRSRSVFMFVSNPSQPYPLHVVVSSLWKDQLTDGGWTCFCRALGAAAAFNLSKLPQRRKTLLLPLQQRIILLLLWNICEQRRPEQKLGTAEHRKLTLQRLRAAQCRQTHAWPCTRKPLLGFLQETSAADAAAHALLLSSVQLKPLLPCKGQKMGSRKRRRTWERRDVIEVQPPH